MRSQPFVLFLSLLFSIQFHAQDMADYSGGWKGKIENSNAFSLKVEINNLGLENGTFKISNHKGIINYSLEIQNTSRINIPFSENQFFEGVLSENGKEINGFIKSGLLLYHIKLIKAGANSYMGEWKVLMVDALKSLNVYLSVENGSGNEYQAYPVFGDNRFTGTWCDNFQKENDLISFTDFKTGLEFRGKLEPNNIRLGILLGNQIITEVDLERSKTDWVIGGFKNEQKISTLQLPGLEHLIMIDSLPNTHSVLVSKKGELLYENYFAGYNDNIPHDTRSASKSISSSIVGLAKDRSLFESVDQSIFDFLPDEYQIYKDTLKSNIDLKSLLTMSSGLDAIDYGIDANPESSAVEDNYQMSNDWMTSVLTAPMINVPNTKANYGSANPYLLGIALDSMAVEPLVLFIDKNLFQKIGISNYMIQTDMEGKPYFGGGMYLTPKDMLKFGQLYLNNGKYGSNQVLSENWVKDTFQNYRNLENVPEKNGYGYLWWHNSYKVNEKSVKSIEARGAGGQYIFILPEIEVVVVITSGNYRNGKTQQPEIILEKHILPYLDKD